MFGEVLCLRVSQNGSSGTAHTRKHTHESTDQRRTNQVHALSFKILQREFGVAVHFAVYFFNLEAHAFLCLFKNLSDRKQTDQNRKQLEAVLHFGLEHSRNHTVSVIYAEHTDQAGQYAKETGKYATKHLALGQSCDNRQRKQDNKEFLDSTEFQSCGT